MAYDTILVERRGPAVVVTLNRPEKLNALNQQMLAEFADVLAQVGSR